VYPVQFNVAQLLKEPIGSVRRYSIEEDIQALAQELQMTAPLAGKVQFLHTPDGVLVTGHLHTAFVTDCVRCLAPAQQQIEFDLEEEFKATVQVLTGAPIAVDPDEDPALLIDAQHILDLVEVVRQELWLSQDPAPLCRPDCRGLCPTCGKDLNTGPCDCADDEVDARWAALRHLNQNEE
jgi:uncharacterized protein